MRALHRGFVLLLMLGLSGAAFARSNVPIQNFEHNTIPPKAGTQRTLEDVQHAITVAGAKAGHWSVSESSPGRMKLTVMTRSHSAVVEITFDTQSYSIHYVDSTNLNYKKTDTEELIHPHYNGWVLKLKQNIDQQLL
ncbi:MAG TPA: hypothetical protein VMU00_06940 [Steroidobacteraceae bacterium]|nr:hypothetical protein [Steroidobacteraceae bacterium]